MNKSTIISIVSLVAILLVVSGIVAYASHPKLQYSQDVLTGVAKALAAKQVTMYGAAWCPHCQAEKARFGDAFQYVPYVECPANEKLCLDKGVKGYPTWIAADGTKYEGEQGIQKLAEIAGYALPQ